MNYKEFFKSFQVISMIDYLRNTHLYAMHIMHTVPNDDFDILKVIH